MTTVIGAIREYFLLDQARATAKIVPEDTRVALSRQLALARQRAEAADALWSNGHVAEGLRLGAEAFGATLDALDPFGHAIAPSAAAPEASAAGAPAETEEAPEELGHLGASEEGGEGSTEEAPDTATEIAVDTATEIAVDTATEIAVDTAVDTSAGGAADDAAPEPSRGAEPQPSADEPRALEHAAEPGWAALLRRRGLSEGKVREALEAHRQLAARTLPNLDDEVSAADGDLFQQLALARRHVDRVLAPASMTTRQLTWTRVSRIGFAAFVGLATAAGLFFVLRPATGVTTTASGQWSAEFSAERAVDGDPATEWLLPDRQEGWLDLRIAPATRMERIRLKNAHNRHYNDRATQAYTVEVYSNDQLVRTVEGEWSGIAPRPEWTDHALGVDDVTRVRIQVRSWHRVGGGLAEVDWD